MNLSGFVSTILTSAAGLKYPLLFVGSIIEGPILFFVSGILLKMKVVSLIPLFIALMCGDLVGDVAWYYIGHFFAEPAIRKKGKFIGLTAENIAKAKEYFVQKHETILFTSKATLGYGTSMGTLVILMTAGITGIPIPRFLWLNALGEIILLTIFISSGYLFGGLLDTVDKDLKVAVIVGFVIICCALFYGFTRYIKGKKNLIEN